MNSIPKEDLKSDHNKEVFVSNDLIAENKNCIPNLSDAMDKLELVCTSFDSLYAHDLKGWVDRMPKVETNSNLEQKTETLKNLLFNMHEKTKAISTIRASCNGIASKSRQLDTILSNPKPAKCLSDT